MTARLLTGPGTALSCAAYCSRVNRDSTRQKEDTIVLVNTRNVEQLPRIPLEASVDLTYRCNNQCRHCWLWLDEDAPEQADELDFDEWREIVDQARALGTRQWSISGGEPMLRDDFGDIFEYVTSKASDYTLNTNGTLITPAMARLLRRKGSKMVAVYGATAEVYDHVTRNPGGYEALLQGLAYLKEAGAGFIVQLIPMRDNWHQWEQMQKFALSWSKHYRVGAPWLWKTACGDSARNAEIERQRLYPADVVDLDRPDLSRESGRFAAGAIGEGDHEVAHACPPSDHQLYAACVDTRRDFHVDPYGTMSLCGFVKDPVLRCDLRQDKRSGVPRHAVRRAWEEFIPSLSHAMRGAREYAEGCGACELRGDCRWCDVYGHLERGRHGAKIDYLCAVARENRAFKERWVRDHTRFFEIAGMTVQVESDLPMTDATFHEKFRPFRVGGAGDDTVVIRHHFGLPDLEVEELGPAVHSEPPWAIYRKGQSWIYLGISPSGNEHSIHRVAVFNADHTRGELYNDEAISEVWCVGGLQSLTMFPTDQILLARLLADRGGCFLHSGALKIDGHGLVFVGHSDAGKSTTMQLVRQEMGARAEILCDDRNVVRRWPEGFRVHGTWSHGDVPDVSSASAPLRAILFLEQHERNEIVPLTNRKEIWRRLLATLIKPLVTAEWWHREMDVLGQIVDEVPCYAMRFDKSGAIVTELERLLP